MNFLSRIKKRLVAAGATSAQTDVEGDVVDMQGFDGVVFSARIATANAGNYLKAQQGDKADGTDMADLADTKVVAAHNGDVVAVEVYRPTKRYVRGVIIRSGAATVTGDMYADQHGAAVLPVSNNVDDVIVSEIHISPDEGAL